eukprot:symbB.v1.2.013220.t1/scaffold890.1/size154879/6
MWRSFCLWVCITSVTVSSVAAESDPEPCHQYPPRAFARCGKECKRWPEGRARADCAVTCLMNNVKGLRGHCAGCYGAQVDCAVSKCFWTCPKKPASRKCRKCRRDHCTPCGDEDDDSNDDEDLVGEGTQMEIRP